MKADLAAKLQSAMREEVARNYPVTRVTGVTCNTSKSLMLHHYTCNTLKSASWENDEKERVTKGVTIPPAPDSSLAEDTEIELEERKAMAMGGVPEPYLDAWARLQYQKPMRVSMRNGGKSSMTRAASWTNGEAALSNSAGRRRFVRRPRDGNRAA